MLPKPDSSVVNIDESSASPSVNVINPVEASSVDLRLDPEVGINQVGESYKVRNSSSWKHLTELISGVIKTLMEIHETEAEIKTPEHFREKPQPKMRYQKCDRQISSII